jgi:hypothetical protein
MKTKLFELRDKATFIPILAVELNASNEERLDPNESYLLRRCGYPVHSPGDPIILLTRLVGDYPASASPDVWGGRTFPPAHKYIITHWHELSSGDVIDVEYILGETISPKISERFITDKLS